MEISQDTRKVFVTDFTFDVGEFKYAQCIAGITRGHTVAVCR